MRLSAAKLGARGRNPERSRGISRKGVEFADVAQLVEHSLGKGEVTSSILVIGSRDSYLAEGLKADLRAGVTQW